MPCLYGDNTNSPQGVAFLAFVKAVVNFAVRTLRAESGAQRCVDEAGGRAEFPRCGSTEVPALSRHHAGMSARDDTEQVVLDSFEAEEALDRLGMEMLKWRRCSLEALGAFLCQHDLPDSSSMTELTFGSRGSVGYLHIASGLGLRATLELSSSDRPFADGALPIECWEPKLDVLLPTERRWFGGGAVMREYHLSRYSVTRLVRSAASLVLEVHPDDSGTKPGWEICVPRRGAVTATPVSSRGRGDAMTLPESEAEKLLPLVRQLSSIARDVSRQRVRLISADLDGHPFIAHPEPGIFAKRLLSWVGPAVREIDARSPNPEELVLKRLSDDCRREEVFLSKAEIHRMLRTLPSTERRWFEPLGFMDGLEIQVALGSPTLVESIPIPGTDGAGDSSATLVVL